MRKGSITPHEHAFDVCVVIGSQSDVTGAQRSDLYRIFDEAEVHWELTAASAHRHPVWLQKYCKQRFQEGTRIFIAFVGMKPDLAPAIAAVVPAAVVIAVAKTMPDLGVNDPAGSIMTMPPGTPLACAGYNGPGLTNAALLAVQLLGLREPSLSDWVEKFKENYKPGPLAGLDHNLLKRDQS